MTLVGESWFSQTLDHFIDNALAEDIGAGDLTKPGHHQKRANRYSLVLC